MRCWSIKLSTRKFWDKFWLNVSVPHSNTAVSPRSLSLEKFLSHETSLAARREEIRLYLHAGYWRFFRFCSAVFIFLWNKAHWIFCFSLFFGLFRVWIAWISSLPLPPPPHKFGLKAGCDHSKLMTLYVVQRTWFHNGGLGVNRVQYEVY